MCQLVRRMWSVWIAIYGNSANLVLRWLKILPKHTSIGVVAFDGKDQSSFWRTKQTTRELHDRGWLKSCPASF